MNNVVMIPQPNELREFMDFLFEGLEGFMYVVAKQPDDPDSWDQVFYEYPAQVDLACRAISHYTTTQEIYIAPALFKSKNAQKENVKVTNVTWCDFDGNTPSEFDIPPSLVVRSSEPGHEHVYWKLDTPLQDVEQIDDYNRRLCYKYGADNSGWDANQVLRPPTTLNHKRNRLGVGTIYRSNTSINKAIFDDLAPAPEKTVDYALWTKVSLPSINDVIYANRLPPTFRAVFEKPANEVLDRSASLTNMAFICAEANLSDTEIYVVLDHLATRWEKFKHHTPSSRARQLIGIIEHARIKYPLNAFAELDQVFEYSPLQLLQTDIQIEWAIEDLLIKNGSLLLAGPGGVGKSRFSLQFMFHLAMGKDFLHYSIPKPQKTIFFSLEMGDLELKHMLSSMYPGLQEKYSEAELLLLNQNLKLLPFGEALPLNTQQGQDVMLDYLERYQPDGVFVDSVGSAILGSINEQSNVQGLVNFNDKIRKRYNCFLWYIHHMRKQSPGVKGYGGGDDIYGDIYLTNRATSVYTLTKAKDNNLRVRNTKQRHAFEEDPYLIRRTGDSSFEFVKNETEDDTPVGNNLIKGLILGPKDPLSPENDQSPNLFGD